MAMINRELTKLSIFISEKCFIIYFRSGSSVGVAIVFSFISHDSDQNTYLQVIKLSAFEAHIAN